MSSITSIRPRPNVRPAPLPTRKTFRGPLTTARLQRSLLAYAALCVSGGLLVALGSAASLHAFGLGLMAPGAGFLIGGHWLAFVGVVLAFLLAFAWFFMGNVFAPVGLWGGAAVVSAAVASDAWDGARWIFPIALAVALAVGGLARGVTVSRTRRRAQVATEFLERRSAELALLPPARPEPGTRELSGDQLAHLRFALDRGLQPLDEFAGLEGCGVDDRLQFFETSLRYQMCQSGWTLSQAHWAYMPAFQGYVAEAQRNFVTKMLHHRVWTYWEIQNLWGNARRDADPVKRDNIMYSGYYAYLLAGYLSNTHDDRFDRPGSMTFHHPDGRAFEYDVHRFMAAVMDNFRRSPYCLFPCEPGWSYTMCNGYARLALPVYDRLYGTDLVGEIGDEYRQRFEEEFATLEGRYPMAINVRTGLTLSRIARATPMFDGIATWQNAPVDRPIARRTYELMREYRIGFRPGQPVDITTNVFPDGMGLGHMIIQDNMWTYASVLAAAAEMGDTELVAQLLVDIEERFPSTTEGGVKRYDGAGVWSQMFLLLGQLSGEGEHWARLNEGIPEHIRKGPRLVSACYPDVLVARATSDGEALHLVLAPGHGAGRFDLGIDQLRPGAAYTVTSTGQDVVADARGRATVRVELTGRKAVHLVPER